MVNILESAKLVLQKGYLNLGDYEFQWSVRKTNYSRNQKKKADKLYKIHIGPGRGWEKPGEEWLTLDIDPTRADIVVNFNYFEKIALEDCSVQSIYGSHVFEHISIYLTSRLFEECYRVLVPGGYFRLVLPDARKSIEEYLQGNLNFPLFKRRKERAKERYGLDYTLFECMREDFLSRSGQAKLLGSQALAHQNAWDFETIVRDLCRAGFRAEDIQQVGFRHTHCPDFEFEGSYPSEANEDYRSLYVEARKSKLA